MVHLGKAGSKAAASSSSASTPLASVPRSRSYSVASRSNPSGMAWICARETACGVEESVPAGTGACGDATRGCGTGAGSFRASCATSTVPAPSTAPATSIPIDLIMAPRSGVRDSMSLFGKLGFARCGVNGYRHRAMDLTPRSASPAGDGLARRLANGESLARRGESRVTSMITRSIAARWASTR